MGKLIESVPGTTRIEPIIQLEALPVEVLPEYRERYLTDHWAEMAEAIKSSLEKEETLPTSLSDEVDEQFFLLIFSTLKKYSAQREDERSLGSWLRKHGVGMVLRKIIEIVSKPIAVANVPRATVRSLRIAGIFAIRDRFYGGTFWADKALQKVYSLERRNYERVTQVHKITAELLSILDAHSIGLKNAPHLIDLFEHAKNEENKNFWSEVLKKLTALHVYTGFNHLDEELDKHLNLVFFVALNKQYLLTKDTKTVEDISRENLDQFLDSTKEVVRRLLPIMMMTEIAVTISSPI